MSTTTTSGPGITLGTWARVHGFHSTDEAATYLDLGREVVALSWAPICADCQGPLPLTPHAPRWS